jgi:hypothetical protein
MSLSAANDGYCCMIGELEVCNIRSLLAHESFSLLPAHMEDHSQTDFVIMQLLQIHRCNHAPGYCNTVKRMLIL